MKVWIARTTSGGIYLFKNQPFWKENVSLWCEELKMKSGETILSAGAVLYPQMFPEVTFENSPQQVEIKLI